jgi:hypothetical protein
MKTNSIRHIHWAASVPAVNATAAGNSHRSHIAMTKFALVSMPLRLKFRRTLPIVALTIVSTLAAGNALGTTTVTVWGSNSSGQTNVPADLTNVLAIAPGSSASHILALRADGTIVAWGNNSSGQTNVPSSLSNVVAVAVGLNHSLALKADGTVAAWGSGTYGQLNVPADLTNAVAIAAGGYHNLALKRDKTVVAWGASSSGQTAIPAGLTNVVAVAGGNQFSLALKADGRVTAWGDNSSSQTNVPANLTNAVAIAAGWIHGLALKADGTVVGWGENSSGQTTIPTGLTNVVAIAAGGFHSLALKADKTVVAWGANSSGQTNVPTGLTNAVDIAAGRYHSLALVGSLTPGSVVYAGLLHQSLGNATLNLTPTNTLIVGNLGSSGLDGVSVTLPPGCAGWGGQFVPLDPSNDLPVGSYLQEQLVGTAGSLTNGLLATTTITKVGTTNWAITADFTVLGATLQSVVIMSNNVPVFRSPESTHPEVRCSMAPWTLTQQVPYWVHPGELWDWSWIYGPGWPWGNGINFGVYLGGTNIYSGVGNEVIFEPANGSISNVTVAAIQLIGGGGLGSFTLTNESVAVAYDGLLNWSLGNATLNVTPTNTLIVGNLGSSGQDGVMVALPNGVVGWEAHWLDMDPGETTVPAGAYLQKRLIGTAGLLTNGVLATLTTTKMGVSNYVETADFSPLGATTLTLQGYNGGNLVFQTTVSNLQPIGPLVSCVESDNHMIWIYTNHFGLWANWPATAITWLGRVVEIKVNGFDEFVDRLQISPQDMLLPSGPFAVQILASQIPLITVTNQSYTLAYNGLNWTALGNASLNVQSNQLVVGNLGSSGAYGVSLALPTNTVKWGVQWMDLDPGETNLPAGAFLQEQLIGTAGNVTNGVLATLMSTKLATSNYVFMADGSRLGTNMTGIGYVNGNQVFLVTNLPSICTNGGVCIPNDNEGYVTNYGPLDVGGVAYVYGYTVITVVDSYGGVVSVETNYSIYPGPANPNYANPQGRSADGSDPDVTDLGWVVGPLGPSRPAINVAAINIQVSQIPAIVITNVSIVNPASPTATITASPSTVSRNQASLISVTATSGPPDVIVSVALDASSIGGSAVLRLIEVGTSNVYTNTVVVPAALGPGTYSLLATVTDSGGLVGMAGTNLVVMLTPPATISFQTISGGGGFNLNWPANQGWILQQTTNLLHSWNDVTTTSNAYHVVPALPDQFFRLRSGP